MRTSRAWRNWRWSSGRRVVSEMSERRKLISRSCTYIYIFFIFLYSNNAYITDSDKKHWIVRDSSDAHNIHHYFFLFRLPCLFLDKGDIDSVLPPILERRSGNEIIGKEIYGRIAPGI